jgi:hypothetical protein
VEPLAGTGVAELSSWAARIWLVLSVASQSYPRPRRRPPTRPRTLGVRRVDCGRSAGVACSGYEHMLITSWAQLPSWKEEKRP